MAKIEHKELNVYYVTLDKDECKLVKSISLCDGISIEQAFANALETGLHTEEQVASGKE